jgi:hypothetical protein
MRPSAAPRPLLNAASQWGIQFPLSSEDFSGPSEPPSRSLLPDPSRFVADLEQVRQARNAVAHHRPMKLAFFERADTTVRKTLRSLGVDPETAGARLWSASHALRRDMAAGPALESPWQARRRAALVPD